MSFVCQESSVAPPHVIVRIAVASDVLPDARIGQGTGTAPVRRIRAAPVLHLFSIPVLPPRHHGSFGLVWLVDHGAPTFHLEVLSAGLGVVYERGQLRKLVWRHAIVLRT